MLHSQKQSQKRLDPVPLISPSNFNDPGFRSIKLHHDASTLFFLREQIPGQLVRTTVSGVITIIVNAKATVRDNFRSADQSIPL